jgi:hypothetical protein
MLRTLVRGGGSGYERRHRCGVTRVTFGSVFKRCSAKETTYDVNCQYILICSNRVFYVGSYNGLFRAPAEEHMDEVQPITYAHVPTAWTAMLVLTWAFISAVMFFIRTSWH